MESMMKPHLEPTRKFAVGDRRVYVYDHLFEAEKVKNFSNIVSQLNFQRRQSFDRELNAPIEADKFRAAPFLWPTTQRLFEEVAKPEFDIVDTTVGLSHVYSAAMGPESCGTVHQDIDARDAITFLYYANLIWRGRWGGETVFYDNDLDAVAAVTPKPGRLVMFHSNLFHRAGIPHPDTPTHRYTVSVFYYPLKPAAEDAAGTES